MRLLVLGGNAFVGYAVARAATARDWVVECVNRGSAACPPGTRTVITDRTDAVHIEHVIHDFAPDVVLDTWEGSPEVAAISAAAAARSATTYGYVSTRSVYRTPIPHGADERSPLVDPGAHPSRVRGYAQRKLASEIAVTDATGGRAAIFRAGLIVGPRENSGRLVWWLRRCRRGGRLIAPAPGDLGMQLVDVRDLAEFVVDTLAGGWHGVVDVVAPPGTTTTSRLLELAGAATGGRVEAEWIDPDWLIARGVVPIDGIPLWAPNSTPERGLHTSSPALALSRGLRPRDFAETVGDTWDHLLANGIPGPDPARVGLSPAREEELLDAWATAGGRRSGGTR